MQRSCASTHRGATKNTMSLYWQIFNSNFCDFVLVEINQNYSFEKCFKICCGESKIEDHDHSKGSFDRANKILQFMNKLVMTINIF